MSALTNAAWQYHRAAFNIVTTRPESRVPFCSWKGWSVEHQSDHDIKRMLLRSGAEFGVGIITGLVSGLVCVDDDGGLVDKLVADFPELKDWFGATARQRTGSGKHHYVGTIDQEMRTWRHHDDVHGDVLGRGAWFTAAPTLHHRTGKPFVWEVPLSEALPLPSILFDSPWLPRRAHGSPVGAGDQSDTGEPIKVGRIDRGRKPHYVDCTLYAIATELRSTHQGERQDALNRKAFHFGANVATRRRDLERARRMFVSASVENGLVASLGNDGLDGLAECESTVVRGLRAGWLRAVQEVAGKATVEDAS